jgi:serine/threonine-protein kinase RsbT
VRQEAVRLGFSIVNQTKLVTAASELARNAVAHGGGGTVTIEAFEGTGTHKLQLTFEDRGPGIPDVELALRDGYSSGGSLGIGLGGSKRLVDEFELDTHLGRGTRVRIARRL